MLHDVFVSPQTGATALFVAAEHGHAAAAQVLVDAKADLNLQDKVSGGSSCGIVHGVGAVLCGPGRRAMGCYC